MHLVQLCVPLYTCSICKTIFADVKYRIEHEKKHILPAKFIRNSINQTVSAIEDTINTEQQEFLGYFNLVKQIHLNVSAMDQLATRKNLLKSLKRIGNVIGSYSCHYCE